MTTLSPCPFCDCVLAVNDNTKDFYVRRYGAHYQHPQSVCILSDFEVTPSEVAEWNKRASHEQARGQDFRTLLEEAVDDIEDLASYAPKYFREKLNIEGTLAKYRAALAGAGESK